MKTLINYSGIPALIIMAALVFMPVSCSKEPVKDNPDVDNSSQLIKISGEDSNAGTKTVLVDLATLWLGGIDKVGVYCPEAQEGDGRENIPYTASGTAFTITFTGAMKWGTGTHNFYAYYPYLAGSAVATVVPITLTAAQEQSSGNSSAHIGALDFMVANPMLNVSQGTTGTSTTVNLHYNHVFTVLEFQIVGTGTLQAVKLLGTSTPVVFSSGTIDITQGTPTSGTAYTLASQTGTTTQAVVTLSTPATLTANHTDTKVYMVINPGTQTGSCLIGLKIGGTWTYISKPAPVISGETRGFLRGKKYVVEIHTADATALPPVDYDGNVYNTVTIGTQTWMTENLKTTHYNDGTDISNITDNTSWAALSTGSYCDYSNTSSNSTTYGRLYNWFAVDNNDATKMASNGGKNICPIGWHVPTSSEWNTLLFYLEPEFGGSMGGNAGGKLKETGTVHWSTPNEGAVNTYGFTALPGGFRDSDGTFGIIGNDGRWWSSSWDGKVEGKDYGKYRNMNYSISYVVYGYELGTDGYSVRCLKDLSPG